MHRLYVVLMIVGLTAAPVFAQEKAVSADEVMAELQSKLNLTQDQMGAVAPILEKYTARIQEIEAAIQKDPVDASLRPALKQLRGEEAKDLSYVLSSQQLSEWKSLQRGKHEKREQPDNGESNMNPASGGGEPHGGNE